MTREPAAVRRISSGGRYEPIVGYSRAVVVGPLVEVAGTTAPEAGDDAYEQAKAAIEKVRLALAEAGCALADVVRTRMFVTDIARWEEYGRAHGEAFGDVRPAATMVEVSALIDPAMLVEVEATAYRA
jgi:enamine deaminase RidA (YjgF/YER057c/UK114 family)